MKCAPPSIVRFSAIFFLIFIQIALSTVAGADSSIEQVIDSIRATQKYFIVCDGECPTYLGLITLYFKTPSTEQNARQFEQCLSTLIAPDEILTSQHCIPPLPLQKYIRVIFPKSGSYPAEAVIVKQLLYESNPLQTPLLDYAILKLDHSLSRPSARLSPTILAKGEVLGIFNHSIQTDEKTGVNFLKLKMKKCMTSEGSVSDGKSDVEIGLRNCITSEGDSGGPILNSNGGLAGVVWGGGVSDTYGVNLSCAQNLPDSISNSKCIQSVEAAAFHLVQTVAFHEIFEIQKFGARAPVSEDVTGGKIFVSAVSCFSQLPDEKVEITETAVFVDQRTLAQRSLPVESVHSFARLPIIMVFRTEADHLLVQVLSQSRSPIFSYRVGHCLKN